MIQMKEGVVFAKVGSVIVSLMFVWAMFKQYFPYELQQRFEKYTRRVFTFVYPYIQITFHEFTGERLMRSEAYSAIETYLSTTSSLQAKRLKAEVVKNNQSLVLSMDDHEEVADHFNGVKLWWASGKHVMKSQTLSFYQVTDEKRYYKLRFHKKQRELIIGPYLNHVIKQGKAIKVQNRQRKLYTNNGSHWNHVVFEHPATFKTLAMDPIKKKGIMDDLISFSQSEEFYTRIGRAWKRGFLLFGPPGTGKSSMIAAMANLLNYDVYDLELTAVKNNTELRKLLIETSSKSIVVVEDIDCSLDLTGQRKKKKEKEKMGDKNNETEEKPKLPDEKNSQVTLSGLLNSIDGLWSACGGERIIVFTTNFIEKLDPALIRKGRMDKHIELSYCSFEAFKVLANNYLQIDAHQLFDKISGLLEEVKMTPADVAEHLMPVTVPWNADVSLEGLVKALEMAKLMSQEQAALTNKEEEEEKEAQLEDSVLGKE